MFIIGLTPKHHTTVRSYLLVWADLQNPHFFPLHFISITIEPSWKGKRGGAGTSSSPSPLSVEIGRSQLPLNFASLPSNVESNSPTSLIAPEEVHRTNVGVSFMKGKPPAGILIDLADGAGVPGPISIVNSFNKAKTRTSDSHNNSSIRCRSEYVNLCRDDPDGDECDFPPSGAPDITYPVTPASPFNDRPSSLPGALPHLFDALYADLDSVARLLDTRPPSARDLEDITHLIKVAAAFRERLQQADPGRQEFTSMLSPTFHSSRGPIYPPTPLHGTPCYLQGHYFPPDAHACADPHHFHGDMAVLPPAPNSLASDPKSTRRGSKYPALLNVFRPLIALVGPTK